MIEIITGLVTLAQAAPHLADSISALLAAMHGSMTQAQRDEIDAKYQERNALRKEHFPTE